MATPAAALLSYVLWIEPQTEATFTRYASNLPRDRADAIAQGLINIGGGYYRLPLQLSHINNESMSRNYRHAVRRRP